MLILNKDILTVKSGYILHQVNCKSVMGAGIAKSICWQWPKVKHDYIDYCADVVDLLGSVQTIEVSTNLYIINLFGQDGYGTDKRYTDYAALASALGQFQIHRRNLDVHIPYGMACGLAGGDWDIVSKLIEIIIPDAIICKKD